ncbi:ATPase, T2SS/T4P/T4SS family [Megasphaera sp.]|uniref:ATPase, T2SS/T4P/T4SS family n=1 Tax=Megasphaera sp. TaxID=2023260 RepID=UPI00351FBD11
MKEIRHEFGANPTFDSCCGPEMTALMHREDITELYVNDDGFLRYLSYKDGKVKTDIYLAPEKVQAIINLVSGQDRKIVNEAIPSVSSEIRGYGARFQGEMPPIVRNPQFNIRKRATKIFTLDEYVEQGVLSQTHKEYLEKAIAARKNILVVGGTGTGKTTFLNAILDATATISPYHRIISLEDLPELQCDADDYSPMYTMQDLNQGIVYNMTMLLKDCMRRSPDRIIVGEVRDGAAYTMLKAWNTGHEGGASTTHADSAIQGLSRIKSLAQEDPDASGDLKELIGEAIDVVVGLVHVDLGQGRRSRKVDDVIAVDRFDDLKKEYVIRHIQG